MTKPSKTTTATPTVLDHAKVLERARKNARRALLKRRQRKSGQ
jgi:hypothetical protein